MQAQKRSVLSSSPRSPVAITLLALLTVFLSSVTYQQVSAAEIRHGFTNPLDHLVVASHHETLGAPSEKQTTDTGGESGPDFPDGWLDYLVVRPTPTDCLAFDASPAVYSERHIRFLTPPLRAPPVT